MDAVQIDRLAAFEAEAFKTHAEHVAQTVARLGTEATHALVDYLETGDLERLNAAARCVYRDHAARLRQNADRDARAAARAQSPFAGFGTTGEAIPGR